MMTKSIPAGATAIAMAGMAFVASPARAYPIAVANSSFEILPTGGLPYACGGACAYSGGTGIPGWVTTSPSTGEWIPGGYNGNPPAIDGNALAWSNGGAIYQTVGSAIAGTTYTLQVDVLDRTDTPATGLVQLEVGSNVVATAIGVDDGPGTWSDLTATYTALAADNGEPLTILLSSSGAQGDFDNVQLTASGDPAGPPDPPHTRPIAVANSSFEILPTGGLSNWCGGTCEYSEGGAIPGWKTEGNAGQWIVGGYKGNPSAIDGDVLAWVNAGEIYQTVGEAIAGTTYTLQVDVMQRTDWPMTGVVQLEIGSTVVATAVGVNAGPGTWSDWTATYTALAGDNGQPLTILLGSSGGQGDFDNVRLTESYAAPEPATWAMLLAGFGAIGALALRRGKITAA